MATDALKAAIATYMSKALLALATDEQHTDDEFAVAGLSGLGIKSIEVHQVGILEASVRVRTEQQGVRYFAVRVSEPL